MATTDSHEKLPGISEADLPVFTISVIVPVYNVAEYLEDFINSIKSQSIDKNLFEMVFVDDASKDNSCEVINSLCQGHFNYRLIQLERQSGAPGRPRNLGLRYSRSKYVVFYDPDDVIPAYALQTKLDLIAKFESQVLSGTFTRFTQRPDRDQYVSAIPCSLVNEFNETGAKATHGVDSPPAIWCRIFDREFLQSNSLDFPEGVFAQDAAFMFNVYASAERMSYVPIPMCCYRLRDSDANPSTTNNLNARYFSDFLATRQLMISRDKALYQRLKTPDIAFVIRNAIRIAGSRQDIAACLLAINGYLDLVDARTSDVEGQGAKLVFRLVRIKASRLLILLRNIRSAIR